MHTSTRSIATKFLTGKSNKLVHATIITIKMNTQRDIHSNIETKQSFLTLGVTLLSLVFV